MPTVPESPPKQIQQPVQKTSSEGRPPTRQYELDKPDPSGAAVKGAARPEGATASPDSSPPPPRSSAPPPTPAADPDRWGMSTLLGPQSPVAAATTTVAASADGATPPTKAPAQRPATPRDSEVTDSLQRGANQLAGALGSGLRAASRSLAESSPGALQGILPGAPSPELLGADPVLALSTRLAAESDFWRRLGLQSLSRVIIADRVGYAVVALGVVGGLGLAVVAGLGGLFAGAHLAAKAAVLLVGALLVLCAGTIAFALTHAIRRTQRDVANGAFTRADHAELRLNRLAVALAVRGGESTAYHAALERVTADSRT